MGKYTKKSAKFFEGIRDNNGVTEKLCRQCNEWKPFIDEYWYYKNKSKPEKGFQSECIICSIKRSSKTQFKNHEHVLQYQKDYAKNNSEWKSDYNRRYMIEHRDEKLDYFADYRQTDAFKESSLKSRLNRELHKVHEITKSEWVNCKSYFNNCCAYCGKPIKENLVMRKGKLTQYDFCKDHAENNGANDITNCVPACFDCNTKKNTLEMLEFMEINNINFNNLDKILQWLSEDCYKYIEEKKPKGKYTKNPNNSKWKIQ